MQKSKGDRTTQKVVSETEQNGRSSLAIVFLWGDFFMIRPKKLNAVILGVRDIAASLA